MTLTSSHLWCEFFHNSEQILIGSLHFCDWIWRLHACVMNFFTTMSLTWKSTFLYLDLSVSHLGCETFHNYEQNCIENLHFYSWVWRFRTRGMNFLTSIMILDCEDLFFSWLDLTVSHFGWIYQFFLIWGYYIFSINGRIWAVYRFYLWALNFFAVSCLPVLLIKKKNFSIMP